MINQQRIKLSKDIKYLGMYLDNRLNWNKHVEHCADKAQRGLNIIKSFCRVWWGGDPSTILTVYKGIVRSHLDYGSFLFKPITKKKLIYNEKKSELKSQSSIGVHEINRDKCLESRSRRVNIQS